MDLFKRENYLSKIRGFYHSTDIIKVLSGVRRCGKSSLLKMISDELIKIGVNKENIYFFNLDKRGYRKIKTSDQLDSLISTSCTAKGIKYLFIDEIQNVKDFEDVINSFREEDEYSLFITGSNSYLLSGELATKLTGRYIEFEIFTLSFEEYIKMKRYYNLNVDINLLLELNNYLNEGGFPRTLFFDSIEDKRKYVLETVKEIFEKDIYKRVKIKNRDTFDLVMNYVINNFGSTMSINGIVKALKERGNIIKDTTVRKYIQTLIDAKIIYECNRFDLKSKKSLQGERKYYLSDISFNFLTNPDSRLHYGQILENIIFIYAKSKNYSISIGRIGKTECDFILKNNRLDYSYVQVSYTILSSKETEDREYKSLELIKDNYPKYLLTTDYLLQKRNGIKHLNIMEFMCNGELF